MHRNYAPQLEHRLLEDAMLYACTKASFVIVVKGEWHGTEERDTRGEFCWVHVRKGRVNETGIHYDACNCTGPHARLDTWE